MDWRNLNSYFESIPEGFIGNLFKENRYPWSPLAGLQLQIKSFFKDQPLNGHIHAERTVVMRHEDELREGAYYIQQSGILTEPFIDPGLCIYIGPGTLVESGATIKDHTIIEKNCEIRQGAYIRGSVFVGEGSVVGHTTEIKNSVFIQHVEAGHFAYIGDSLVGSYVNLGAGTKISNLEFRSLDAKKNELFPHIPFHVGKEKIQTGLSKFGAIIGDGCETGCNSVLCPFVLLAPKCWVMPCHCVLKGIYSRGSVLRQGRSKPVAFV